jgi:flagellar capping protein FliD
MTRRILTTLALAAALLAAIVVPAYAGSPHFVDDQLTATRTGDTLTVSGKEAGLGDETQITVEASATAACLNPGDNFPQAANKESVTASAVVPVQNGKAYFSLDLVATFQPSCSPPMTVVFGDVTVTDTTNGISTTLSGLF